MSDAAKNIWKRIAQATTVILTLVALTLSIALQRFDAKGAVDDLNALIELKQFNEKLNASLNSEHLTISEQVKTATRNSIRADIAQTHPELSSKISIARDDILRNLAVGFNDIPALGCVFYSRPSVEGKPLPGSELTTGTHFSVIDLVSPFFVTKFQPVERRTVAHLVEIISMMKGEVKAGVVHSPILAKHPEDFCDPPETVYETVDRRDRPQTVGQEVIVVDPEATTLNEARVPIPVVRLKSVNAFEDRIIVSVMGSVLTQMPPMVQAAQAPPEVFTTEIKGTRDEFRINLAEILKESGLSELVALMERFDGFRRGEVLAEAFKAIPVELAKDTVEKSVLQNYSGAEFLGMKISANRVAVSLFVGLLVFQLTVAFEVWRAAKRNITLQSDFAEGLTGALISLPIGRIFAWIVAPTTVAFFASPSSPWPGILILPITFSGCLAVYLSFRVFEQ